MTLHTSIKTLTLRTTPPICDKALIKILKFDLSYIVSEHKTNKNYPITKFLHCLY